MAKGTPNTETALVAYGDFDEEQAAKEVAEAAAARPSKRLKLKEGKNLLRYLPPRAGQKSIFRVVYEHFIDLPGAAQPAAFVCPRMEAKRPCKTCTLAKKMQASGNVMDQKRGERLLPQRRIYAAAVNRAASEHGPKIHGMSKTIHESLLEFRNELGVNFSHPIQGIDIVILRKGTTKNDTEYKVMLDPKGASPLHSDALIMNEWLQAIPNLDLEAVVLSDEEIDAKLRGESTGRYGSGGREQSLPREARPARGRTVSDDAYGGEVVTDEDE